ncbi:TNF receptor-associated factor 1 isoform X2 [Hemicordylus capensis]|uniref:TNF receptor-associated factor 1 isoform X2 n=1 Tax=Hemicordylus capensis TaxID=884348 RepID=UPI002303E7BB|nr:TNF receptor-associated factor 1 isoform X2 [Hemicordylus capensis]
MAEERHSISGSSATAVAVGSDPGGDEAPLGYPLSVCKDALPAPKYLCSHCKGVLRRALQTACGHRYCSACLAWIIQNDKTPICQSCKADDAGAVNERSLLSVEKAFSDAAINKEISELDVHCGIPDCTWTGLLKTLEEHQSTCEHVLTPCHFGCGQKVARKKLADHWQTCPDGGTSGRSCNSKDPPEPPKGEDGCRFSRIGCVFKGDAEERDEHERIALAIHLALLLRHVQQRMASLCPTGGGVNMCLRDARALKGLFFSLYHQRALEGDSLPLDGERAGGPMPARRAKEVSVLEAKLCVFENIASVLSKEMDLSRQRMVAFRRQRGLDQDTIRGLELKIADLQRRLAQKNTALERVQERLQLAEQASHDGTLLWKITDVHRKCYEALSGRVGSLQSPAFYTAQYGYKLCMRLFLNGEGRGKGSHVSLFLVLLKGDYDALLPWPFAHKITFMLLDQNSGEHLIHTFHPDPTSVAFQRPVTDMNEASGCARFLPLAKLQSPKHAYLKEGTLFLKGVAEPAL